MPTKRPKHRKATRAKKPRRPDAYLLKLYIAGMSVRSVTAIRSIQRVCKKHLGKDYQLEVVDLYHQPGRAREEQIIAVPTLIKKLPAPLRRLVGDMTDEARVMTGLGVKPK